jgi:hypothetical protein
MHCKTGLLLLRCCAATRSWRRSCILTSRTISKHKDSVFLLTKTSFTTYSGIKSWAESKSSCMANASRPTARCGYPRPRNNGIRLRNSSGASVGTSSKLIAYGNNRADYTFIPGGMIPGVVIIEPDFPELKDNWPFLWYENEYVVDAATTFILAANPADAVTH